MGVFIHEYGISDVGTPPGLLEHQLKKARKHLASKKIDGIIILGDREIKKWPASAQAAKNYINAHRR